MDLAECNRTSGWPVGRTQRQWELHFCTQTKAVAEAAMLPGRRISGGNQAAAALGWARRGGQTAHAEAALANPEHLESEIWSWPNFVFRLALSFSENL